MNAAASTRHRDRGSVAVVMMLLVTVALGGAGLIVDGGRALAARRHAANTAEAAARFATTSHSLLSGLDHEKATSAAIAHATRSGVAAADIRVEIRDDPAGHDTVFVTITERRTAIFLVLGGREQLTVQATGAARFVYST